MLLCIVLTLLAHAFFAIAQNAVPTNSSLPAALEQDAELLIYFDVQPQFGVDFALDASTGQKTNPKVIQNLLVNSNISVITPFNINTVTNGSIAYISCDPEEYTESELGVSAVIQAATKKITVQDPQAGAILLYSIYSSWCNYTQTGSYNFSNVFILPGQTSARELEAAILGNEPAQLAQIFNPYIYKNGTAVGGGGDTTNTGEGLQAPAPATTIAMIILYSVTGVITLCFVVVIVSGVMRARRHPERYGLLNLPVHAHQRRARGIARAMLETIPIVKFGEKEPVKKAQDIEQGIEMDPVKKTEMPKQEEKQAIAAESDEQSLPAKASPTAAESNSSDVQPHVAAEHEGTDNGLACSVCTEDFVKGQDLRVLPCDHRFHPECIDPWLLNVSGTCPLCRIDLRSTEPREDGTIETAQPAGDTDVLGSSEQPNSTDPAPQQTPRFSTFLNRRRMIESTPAQRLRALRALRNFQRNNGTLPNTTEAAGASNIGSTEETATRSNRVSRFFGRGDGNSTPPSAS